VVGAADDDEDVSPELDPDPGEDWWGLGVPPPVPLDPVAYGSTDEPPELGGDSWVTGEPLPVDALALAWPSAGSSPAWTRSARTPKTATALARAPAAKRRALGTRHRREAGAAGGRSGMSRASTRALNRASTEAGRSLRAPERS
jgi:hypothetical protein